jgi:hypothetical protein
MQLAIRLHMQCVIWWQKAASTRRPCGSLTCRLLFSSNGSSTKSGSIGEATCRPPSAAAAGLRYTIGCLQPSRLRWERIAYMLGSEQV